MDAFDTFVDRFTFVHGRLLFALERLVSHADDDARALVPSFVTFLDGHHHAEEHALFPALRRGRLRSTDVAFLAAREHEHRAIARLTRTLEREGPRHGGELLIALRAHLAAEEAGLTAERMREMIDASMLPSPRGNAEVVERLFAHPLLRE